MTPQERQEFNALKAKVEALERVEHVPFIDSIKRRLNVAEEVRIGVASVRLNDLADVNAPAPTTGQVLEWSGTAWINATDNV